MIRAVIGLTVALFTTAGMLVGGLLAMLGPAELMVPAAAVFGYLGALCGLELWRRSRHTDVTIRPSIGAAFAVAFWFLGGAVSMVISRMGIGDFAEMVLVGPTVFAVCALGVTLSFPLFVRRNAVEAK